jgi:hypothetical protein
MRSAAFLIAVEDRRYTVARVSAGGEVALREVPRADADDASALEKSLAGALAELGYGNEGVCLGLPSGLVLPAEIDCADLPRTRRQAAMLYRLEERLPLDAESLTVAFLPQGGAAALGLAVETARVRAIVDSVERAGARVAAICPTSLLALAGSRRAGVAAPDYTVLVSDEATDVLRLSGGTPVRWYTVSTEPAEWVRCLEVDMLTHPHEVARPRAECLGAAPDDAVMPPSAEEAGVSLERVSDEPLVVLAARAARFVLGGANPAWVDFRRGRLAPPHAWTGASGPLAIAVAAALTLLAVLTATFIIRGIGYSAVADAYVARQADEYRRVFPAGDPPPNIVSRMRSETARMSALSGAGEKAPEQANALETLRRVVTNLPPNVRVKVTDMRIGPSDLVMEGEVRTHTDAQLISQALARASFEMDAPRTEVRAADDVAFTLTGTRSGAAPAIPATTEGH